MAIAHMRHCHTGAPAAGTARARNTLMHEGGVEVSSAVSFNLLAKKWKSAFFQRAKLHAGCELATYQ